MPPPPIATLDNDLAGYFTDTGSGGQGWSNTSTQLDFGQDWTHTVLFGFDGATPSGQTRIIFQAGWNDSMRIIVSCDDTDTATLSLYMTPDGGGGFNLTDSITRTCPIISGDWNTHALVYDAGTTTLSWYVNAELIGATVFDLSFFYDAGEGWFDPPPASDNVPIFLGVDDSSARIFADHFFVLTKHWQDALTPTEMADEFSHVCPQIYTNLICDAPIFANALNGYDGDNHWQPYTVSGAGLGYSPNDNDPTPVALPSDLCPEATISLGAICGTSGNDGVVWFFSPSTGQKVGARTIPVGGASGSAFGITIADTGEIAFSLDNDVWTSDLITNNGPSTGVITNNTNDQRAVVGLPFADGKFWAQLIYYPSLPTIPPYQPHIRTFDETGTIIGSDIVCASSSSIYDFNYAAVNEAATFLYWTGDITGTTQTVKRINLPAGTAAANLYDVGAGHNCRGSVAVDRSSGNVIITDRVTATGAMSVKAINSSGVLVWSTAISDVLTSSKTGAFNYPTITATSIWLYYKDSRGNSRTSLSELRLSDGAILATITSTDAVFGNEGIPAVTLDDIVSSCPTAPVYSPCASAPTLTFPDTPGEVGIPYSEGLVASGGTPPYGPYTITVGTLPYGLSLDAATGVISGIPTNVQTANFTAQVTDDNSQTADCLCSIAIGANMTIKSVGLIDPVLQFEDGDGLPYASGSVAFYAVGTSNLLDVYSDDDLATPLPNPVPLNAAGRSSTSITGVDTPVYCQQKTYDYSLFDADSVLVYGPITFSGSQWPGSIQGQSVMSPAANANAYANRFTTTINKAVSGTHALFAGTRFDIPTIGAAASTLTESATVYIEGPPATGTNPYALHVAAGTVKFDGPVVFAGNGGSFGNYRPVTANTNAVAGDRIVVTANTPTITLPAASANLNAFVVVLNNGTGLVTISPDGSDKVGLATSQTLNVATATAQGDSLTLVSDGISNWNIV